MKAAARKRVFRIAGAIVIVLMSALAAAAVVLAWIGIYKALTWPA